MFTNKNKVHEILGQLAKIRSELRNIALEKELEIDTVLLSLVAKAHIGLIGPRGTAKSMLLKEACRRVTGSAYWDYTFDENTQGRELFTTGSDFEEQNLGGGKKRILYTPVTTGTATEGNICFIDEFGEGGRGARNSLRTWTADNFVVVDGKRYDTDLWTLAVATNTYLGDDEEPLWDRFLSWIIVQDVQQEDNVVKMVQNSLARKRAKATGQSDNSGRTVIEKADMEILQAVRTEVEVPETVIRQAMKIREKLHDEHGIKISSRRFTRVFTLLQAHAMVMRQADTVTEEDFGILQVSFWEKEDDIRKVQRTVLEVANPIAREALKLADLAEEIGKAAVESGNAANGSQAIARIKNEIMGKFPELLKRCAVSGANDTDILQARNLAQEQIRRISSELFGLDI